ncbi:hypothetical protein KCU77_g8011, partial [Aureobasidium melanogenum]
MPLLRPTAFTSRAAQSALVSAPRSIVARRALSTTQQLRGGASHDDHFDPPGGILFGVKPGEKYQDEGWEKIFYWGFFGSLAFGVIGYAYKPDTSIQTWALEEARRRLEAEGILADPEDE